MRIFNFLKKENTVTSPKTNSTYDFSKDFIEHTLDMVIKFINAYKETTPTEWLHFYISYKAKEDYGTVRYFLEFKIIVGTWWDRILYKYPDIVDYMMTIFSFDDSENVFTYYLPVGSGTSFMFPNELKEAIKSYLISYTPKSSFIKLNVDEHGATFTTY